MLYHILGKTVQIFAMQQPEGVPGSVFEFRGDKSLEQIGLKEKFYFQAPDKFYLDPQILPQDEKMPRKGVYQLLLSLYLQKSILHGELVHQWTL
jgi:hypothetical protein